MWLEGNDGTAATYSGYNFFNDRLIFADPGSRNLLLFLILNLAMAFVELLYGVWTNR